MFRATKAISCVYAITTVNAAVVLKIMKFKITKTLHNIDYY